MYEWAVGDGDEYGDNGCAVLFDCLPEESGHYVMAYYSYKMEAIISVSEPFEVGYHCLHSYRTTPDNGSQHILLGLS